MWLVLVCVCGQVGDIFCLLFVLFLIWEQICLFCLGKGLEVGVVSVAVNMRRNYLRAFFLLFF